MKIFAVALLLAAVRADEPVSSENDDWTSLIINGKPAASKAYPYYAASTKWAFALCGASLIHPEWAMSAAHCGEKAFKGGIRIGIEDYLEGNPGMETRSVEKFVLHPGWNRSAAANDIMLMKLDKPVTTLKPVTLESDISAPDPGTAVTAIGFGRTNTYLYSEALMEVDLNIVSGEVCLDVWGSNVFSTDSRMCAAADGKDSCSGDSGGPLLDARTNIQVGIVSYGASKCADKERPAVYTRVGHYRKWIAETVCQFSTCHDEGE